DKSLKGRQFAWNLIVKRLHEGSILVFDDIQDNNYFKNFVENHTCSFHVFRFQNKYAGFVHQLKLK
ncbi:MAG: hypothetical protein KGZ74_18710, partial [Chitinophagaceae bacterium]|nr:hypothetical protein [Chitinophagaceae bacterium]